MPINVCYVISHGFAARMVLQSEVIPLLRQKGIEVTVVTPNAREASMGAQAERLGITLEQAPEAKSGLFYQYQVLRRYLFEDVRENPALWSKYLRDLDKPTRNPLGKLRPRLFYALNRIAVRVPAVRRTLRWVERRFLAQAEIADLLRRMRPDAVISTYPVAPIESRFLYEAQRAGIPTISQLLSWDNITSKGHFPVTADYFIAWGSIMIGELKEYYGVADGRAYACGVAHFDRHATGVDRQVTEAALAQLGLDPQKPYLFFAMSSPLYCPYQIDIVEWLAQAVERGDYGEDLQLVVRPHPQNVQGFTADLTWLPRLEALNRLRRVGIDYPDVEESELAWSMKANDLPRLVNLLAGCSICINSGSTISIEAIIHDKPVVLTNFDADRELPWHQSIRRHTDYIHMQKLIGLGGVAVANSFDEMRHLIERYLQDPRLDAEGRAKTRWAQCGPCDGRAAERIADAIASVCQEVSGRRGSRVEQKPARSAAMSLPLNS